MFSKLPFARRMVFDKSTHTLPLTKPRVDKLSPELKQVLENVKIDQKYIVSSKHCAIIANTLSHEQVCMQLQIPGLILGLRQANQRRRCFVTTSLIGWAQA